MSKDIVTRQTTLAELGVTAKADITATLHAPLTIQRKELPEGTVYLAIPERPMIGRSLAYLANSLSKRLEEYKSDSRGIVADLRIYQEIASGNASEKLKQQFGDHLTSFVEPAFTDIGEHHAYRWIEAFEYHSEPTNEVYNFYDKLHPRHLDYLVADAKASALKEFPDRNDLNWANFLRPDSFKYLEKGILYDINAFALSSLTPEQLRLFVIANSHDGRIVADFDTPQLYQENYYSEELNLAPPNQLSLNKNNSTFTLKATCEAEIIGGDLNWSIADYSFRYKNEALQETYEQKSLAPVIAWFGGDRRYITQGELKAMSWADLPANSDTLLGRVLAAYFTPGITDMWQPRMPLHKDGAENDIMGAQALALVSLPHPNFGGRVLRAPDGILSKIEDRLAA